MTIPNISHKDSDKLMELATDMILACGEDGMKDLLKVLTWNMLQVRRELDELTKQVNELKRAGAPKN